MRLIDAEKLAEVLNRYLAAPHVQLRNSDISVGLRMGIKTCLTFLNNANTIEAEPVRHGRWERTADGAVLCTACKRKMNPSQYGYAFCSLCGAKMRRAKGLTDE